MKDFWVMTVSPRWSLGGDNNSQYGLSVNIWGGGREVGRRGEGGDAARLGYSLCQGYKQAVIRLPNRIILPVSAPKHMGPHKAAAAPDRHPLLITQRRGGRTFLPVPFPFSALLSLCLGISEIYLFSDVSSQTNLRCF